MIPARQSTSKIVTVGPILDADGVAVTGGVVGDLKASKNGGAPAALNGSATLTHRHTGFYSLSLTTSDTDTVGSLEITIDDGVNQTSIKEMEVMEEATYDMLYAASAVGYVADQPVNTTKVNGTSQTARDIGASVLLSSGTGTGQINLTSGRADANLVRINNSVAPVTGSYLQVDIAAIGADGSSPAALAAAWGNGSFAANAKAMFDGTGYAGGTAKLGVNAVQISGDSTAADSLETAFDDTAGPVPWIGIVDQGTAQSATSTTVVLRSASAFGDDTLIGAVIGVLGSTQGYWQYREITDSVLSTDTVTVPTFAVTPTGTITYKIWGIAGKSPIAVDVWAAGTRTLTALDEDTTTLDLDATIRAAVGLASANLDSQLLAIDDYLDSEVAAIKTDTGTTLPAQISALMTTAMTEGYSTDGATVSPRDALYDILQHLTEFAITGTNYRVNKRDGSTLAANYTLNSATTPTAITRV